MNRMYYVLLLIFSLFMVVSCAQQPLNTTAAQVEGNTQIETEEHRQNTWVSGPKLGDMFEGEYSLRGNLSGGSISYYELLFLKSRDVKRGEAFYSKSFDNTGQELPVVVISRKAWPHEYMTEVIGVRLTREALTKASKEGLTIHVEGRRDKPVVELPAFYVAGFLKKVDEIVKEP